MRKQFGFEQRDDVLRRDRPEDFAPAEPLMGGTKPRAPKPAAAPTDPASKIRAQANAAPVIMRDKPAGPLTPYTAGLAARDAIGAGLQVIDAPNRFLRSTAASMAAPVGQFLSGALGNAPAPAQPQMPVRNPAATAPAAPAAAPVAAQAPQVNAAPAGAVSATGRQLGYGQQIDGVQVFSDGSGGGGVPRTMSDEQIAALQNGNRVTPVGSSVPAQGVAASMVTGGQTPQMGALTRPGGGQYAAEVANAQAVNRATLERATRDDALDRLNDTTTPEGRLFAQISRNPNTRSKRELLGQLLSNAQGQMGQFDQASIARGTQAERNASDLTATQMQEQGADRRAQMAVDAGGQIQAGDDGAFYRINGGRAVPVMTTEGKQLRAPADDSKRQERVDRIMKELSESVEASMVPGVEMTPEKLKEMRLQAAAARGLQPAQREDGSIVFLTPDGLEIPL